MSQSQFSVSWSAHKENICTGLSALQQNSEFVDMTLAADGHHVKVHQIIMALASPYIKDLISSAHCPHPVIFLNKVSYTTLSAILEYIYTGEVMIPVENLTELIEAGKELCIKGLEDMNFDHSQTDRFSKARNVVFLKQELAGNQQHEDANDDTCFFEVTDKEGNQYNITYNDPNTSIQSSNQEEIEGEQTFDESMQIHEEDIQTDASQDMSSQSQNVVIHSITSITNEQENYNDDAKTGKVPKTASKTRVTSKNMNIECGSMGSMLYTVSNQGSLQLILNRFVYYLKHTKRNGVRQWRCVDYLTPSRCPAIVITNDDVAIQRISAHLHAFHDRRILKKVNAGAVFSAINQALLQGKMKKDPGLESENENSEIKMQFYL